VTELLAELPGGATPEALQDVLRDHGPPCQHEYRELDYSGFLCA
jgi:hypothetical protein